MERVLRLLNVEDSEMDVALLRRHLISGGYDLMAERVETADEMRAALREQDWDIILCDYSMPHFDALSALDVAREEAAETPFIIISGTVSEELAVEAMLSGANDYLPKRNLKRLIPALERELRRVESKRAQQRSDRERRVIFEIISGIASTSNLGEFLSLVHQSISRAVYAENCFVMLHDPATEMEHYEFWVDKHDPKPEPSVAEGSFASYVLRTGKPLLITKESKKEIIDAGEAGQIGHISPSWVGIPLLIPGRTIGVLVLQNYEEDHAYDHEDVAFLSSVGNQIALAIERRRAEEAVIESEERYRDLVENAIDIIYTHDLQGNYTSMNRAGERITGYTLKESLAMNLADTVVPKYLPTAKAMIDAKLQGNETAAYEIEIFAKDGHRIDVEINTRMIYKEGVAIAVQGIARDVTQRRRSERDIRLVPTVVRVGLIALSVLIAVESVQVILQQLVGFLIAVLFPVVFGSIAAGVITYLAMIRHRSMYRRNMEEIAERKLAVVALEQSEASFRALFDNSSDAILVLDEGVFLACNPAAERLFGCDRRDLIGRTPDSFSPEKQPDGRPSSVGAREYLAAAMTGTPQFFEWEHKRSDGTLFDAEVSLSRVGRKGSRRVQGTVRDITERNRSEKQVHDLGVQLTHAMNMSLLFSWEFDVAADLFNFNDAYYALHGTSTAIEGGNGMAVTDFARKFVHPDDAHLVGHEIGKAVATTDPAYRSTVDCRIIRLDGEIRTVHVNLSVSMNAEGRAIRINGSNQDITDRKDSEERLRASEENYRTLFDLVPMAVYSCDSSFKITSYNKAAIDLWGRAPKLGDDVEKYCGSYKLLNSNGTEMPRSKCPMAQVLRNEIPAGYDIEVVIERPDSSRRQVVVNPRQLKNANGEIIGAINCMYDVTEKKEAEARFVKSQQNLLLATESAKLGIWNLDLKENSLTWDSKMYELYGVKEGDFFPTIEDCENYLHPDDRTRVSTARKAALDGTLDYHLEYRIIRPNGDIRHIESRAQIIRQSDGSPDRVVGVNWDITERMEAEVSLRESEGRFRAMVEWSPESITVTCDGQLVYLNPAAVLMMDAKADTDLLGRDAAEFVDPDFRDSYRERLKIQADPDGIAPVHTQKLQTLAGRKIEVESQGRTIMYNRKAAIFGSMRDITDRVQLEHRLLQSQKMEAIGVLAGGIAHDFNNLLTVINGYSDLTLKRMPADGPFRHNVEEVRTAGARAAELTNQLLAFSRKQVRKPAVMNLNSVINNVEKMLRRIIREDIELRVELEPNLSNVLADPGQIEQVIMNLIINSRDSMPAGGTVTIETQNIYLDKDYIGAQMNVAPGEFVRITVTDTGEGIDKEVQKRIFEPFFTTKEAGEGTGLGLSTVYGIIKQTGGDVLVYSELGQGTTFRIHLPATDAVVKKPKWAAGTDEKYLGTETILLVEDEETVRNLVREVLSENGYTVLEAKDGIDALSVCEAYADPIHMLLTDVVMPKMGGGELKRKVVEKFPAMKVLFMSGYTDNSVANRDVFDSANEFLEKPFTADGLSRKVREVFEC